MDVPPSGIGERNECSPGRNRSNHIVYSSVKNSVSQIALFLYPALVLLSLLFDTHLTFVLAPVYVGALGITALALWQITSDGEAYAFEGWGLISLYVIVAVFAYFE